MASAIAHPVLLPLGRITVKEQTGNSSFSSHMHVLTTIYSHLYHTQFKHGTSYPSQWLPYHWTPLNIQFMFKFVILMHLHDSIPFSLELILCLRLVQQLKVSQAVWSSIFMGCESVYRTNFKTDFLLSEILQPQVNYKPQVFTVEGAVMGSWCSLHTFLGVASSWVRSHSGEINHWWAAFTNATPCPVHDRWGAPNLLVIWS